MEENPKPKKELPTEEAIKVAIHDVEEAMLENMIAGQILVDAEKRKETARYNLNQANSRLRGLQQDLMYYDPKLS